MSERPVSPSSPPGLRPVTRTQEWVRRVSSRWAQRTQPGRPAPLAGPQIGRLTARLQRRATQRPTWLRRAGALSPRMVDVFAGALAQRFTPPLVRRAAAEQAASSLPPIDMPLAGGEPMTDAQPAPAQPALWPSAEAPTPTASNNLPPLGARWAGRAAPAAHASPTPAPRPVVDAPRLTAGRIRRYSRVEEVDPLALAAQNERRQAQPSSAPASLPASPTDSPHATASRPAADSAVIQRSSPTPTSPATAPASGPARALPRSAEPFAEAPPVGPRAAGESPAAGVEQGGLSVLQRLRQARTAQLRRQAAQAAAPVDSASQSVSTPAPSAGPASSVELPPRPLSSPPAVTQGTSPPVAPSPATPSMPSTVSAQPSVRPTLRRSVERAQSGISSDEVLPVEQEAGDTLPDQSVAPAQAAPLQTTPASSVSQSQVVPPLPEAAAQDALPASVQRASPAAETLQTPPGALPPRLSLEDAPAEDGPAGQAEPPAAPLPLARPAVRRMIQRAADTTEEEPVGPASLASPASAPQSAPQYEPTAQEVAAAFAERVAARAASQARLPVHVNPERTSGSASDVVRHIVRPPSAALSEPPLAQRRGERPSETDRPEAPVAPDMASLPDMPLAAAPGEAAQNAAPEAAHQAAPQAARDLARISGPVRRSMQTAPAFEGVKMKAPVSALPLLRRRPSSAAVQRSPAVLPQARVLGPSDGQEGTEGDGEVEMNAERERAPTQGRLSMSDRQPLAATSPVTPAAGPRAPATISRRLAGTMPVRGAVVQRASLPVERPALPLVRRTTTPRVQRALEDQPPPASPESAQPGPASSPDLQALARKVYPILKRMLAVERERLYGA